MLELTVFIKYEDGTYNAVEIDSEFYDEEAYNRMSSQFEALETVLRNLYLGKIIDSSIKRIDCSLVDKTIEDDHIILDEFSFTIKK